MAVAISKMSSAEVLPESRLITNSVMSSAKMALIYRIKTNILVTDNIGGKIVEVAMTTSNVSTLKKISFPATFQFLDTVINDQCGVMCCRLNGQQKMLSCFFELNTINVSSKLKKNLTFMKLFSLQSLS